MRAHILFAIPVLAILHLGCGAADPSAPPGPGHPVEPPLSLDLGADALGAGESSTGTINLSSPAPADGAVITLWSSDDTALDLPPSITVPAGDNAATFELTNNYAGQRKSVQIVVTYEGASAEGSLFIPSLLFEPSPCKGHVCRM